MRAAHFEIFNVTACCALGFFKVTYEDQEIWLLYAEHQQADVYVRKSPDNVYEMWPHAPKNAAQALWDVEDLRMRLVCTSYFSFCVMYLTHQYLGTHVPK